MDYGTPIQEDTLSEKKEGFTGGDPTICISAGHAAERFVRVLGEIEDRMIILKELEKELKKDCDQTRDLKKDFEQMRVEVSQNSEIAALRAEIEQLKERIQIIEKSISTDPIRSVKMRTGRDQLYHPPAAISPRTEIISGPNSFRRTTYDPQKRLSLPSLRSEVEEITDEVVADRLRKRNPSETSEDSGLNKTPEGTGHMFEFPKGAKLKRSHSATIQRRPKTSSRKGRPSSFFENLEANDGDPV